MAEKTENRRIYIYINGKEVENNMSSIRKEYAKTNAELNKMTRGTKEYNDKMGQLKDLDKHIQHHRDKLRGVSRQWQEFSKIAGAVIGAGLVQGAIQKTWEYINNLVTGSAALDDAFADVMKTTGLTKAEVKSLNSELGKIDTRTPRARLLELARDAGKLGIQGKKNILEFVVAADKIQVALGEDLGEDAIKNIGKLNDLFKLNDVYGYGQAMEKTGSALNALGAGSTAAEAYLVGFTKRMAGTTSQAGFTIDKVLGLGAALDSLGQTEEVSSTAVGQLITNMFLKTEQYAGLARMSVDEFRTLLQTDANEALIRMLEAVQGNNEGLSTMAAELHDVGITGARATSVVTTLANNTDIIRKQQELANTSFKEGTSIVNEFNLKNETLAAKLEKIGKAINSYFASPRFAQWLGNVIDLFDRWMKIPLSDKLEEERMKLNMMGIELTESNIAEERRIELINELKELYPEHLGNIDAETISNSELSEAIDKVNEMLINKIVLQKHDEAMEEKNQAIAEKKLQILEKQKQLREKMLVYHDKYNIAIKEEGTLVQKVAAFSQSLEETTNARGQSMGESAKIFRRDLDHLLDMKSELNKLDNEGKEMLKDRVELMKELGMTTPTAGKGDAETTATATAGTPPPTPVDDPRVGLIQGANKQIQKAQEELNAAMTVEDIRAAQERIKIWETYKNALLGDQESIAMAAKDVHQQLEAMMNDNLTKGREATEAEMNARGQQNEAQMQREAELRDIINDIKKRDFEAEYENRIAYEIQYWDDKIALAQVMGEDEELLEREKQERISAIKREHLMKQVEELQAYWGAASQFVDIYLANKTNQEAAHIDNLNRDRDAEMANLERLRAADKLSDSAYKEQQFRLNEKYNQKEAAIKRKAFERQKNADIIQAGINAGLAATKTLAQLGLPLAVPALITLATMTAAQIVAIQNKPVPQFGEGGWLKGPRHSGGGMPVIDPLTGNSVAEVEGGEVIGSRGFVAKNPQLAAAVVAASRDGGRAITVDELIGGQYRLDTAGKRVFADGGLFEGGGGDARGLMELMAKYMSQPPRAVVVYSEIEAAGSMLDRVARYNRLS
jgi:TP901 family phage tail tape measure protein